MAKSKAEAGFTLPEVLVVTAILGIVMSAVVGTYQVTQKSVLYASAGEDAQLTARVVLEWLTADLRLMNAGRPTASGAITAASATSITFLGDVANATLDPTTGNDATLTCVAAAGATQVVAGSTCPAAAGTIQVSSLTGFSVNRLFSIADGPIAETQAITAVTGTTVTLGAGLVYAYSAGSIVRSVETVAYTYAATATGGTLTRTVDTTTDTLADNIVAFQLTYWDGSMPPVQIVDLSTQANRDQIREIRVQVAVQGRVGDQIVGRGIAPAVRPRNLLR